MAWENQRTKSSAYIDVSLDEFDTPQLLQGLIDASAITKAEAEFILKRSKRDDATTPLIGDAGLMSLDDARCELLRGRKEEALRHVEEYLGREWIGVLVQ